MRALLVRHCQSTAQHPEAPLTALGLEQREALARFLADRPDDPVDRIVSSPYVRARSTIEPFAARAGLSIAIDDRLHERTLAAEALPHWREIVARGFVDPDHREPGGESGREVIERVWVAIRAAMTGCALPVIAGHGHAFGLVLHSIDPAFGFAGHTAMTNPDVFELSGPDWRFRRLWS